MKRIVFCVRQNSNGEQRVDGLVTISMTLREIVGQAIGEASMCWAPRPSDAVFVSEEAGRILDRVMAIIDERLAAKDSEIARLESALKDQGRVLLTLSEQLAAKEEQFLQLRAAATCNDANLTDRIRQLTEQLAVIQKELAEQCRINGIGAQRELKLMTELREARKVIDDLMPAAMWFIEGPYGSSPDLDCLKRARAFLAAHPEAEKS